MSSGRVQTNDREKVKEGRKEITQEELTLCCLSLMLRIIERGTCAD